jgi:hypothetical protein
MNTFNESQIKEICIAFELLCSEYYTVGKSEGVELHVKHAIGTTYINTFNDSYSAMVYALREKAVEDPSTRNVAEQICYLGMDNLNDYVEGELDRLQHSLEQQKNYLNKAVRTSSNYLYSDDPSLLNDAYRLSRSAAAHASSIKNITKQIVLMRKLEFLLIHGISVKHFCIGG